MAEFKELWQLFRAHGSSNKREKECAALWASYSPALQEHIYNAICTKLEHGKFVHYDPLRAMKENAQAVRKQTLSFAAYYDKYHTTAERDGWKMMNPTGQRVVYIRVGG